MPFQYISFQEQKPEWSSWILSVDHSQIIAGYHKLQLDLGSFSSVIFQKASVPRGWTIWLSFSKFSFELKTNSAKTDRSIFILFFASSKKMLFEIFRFASGSSFLFQQFGYFNESFIFEWKYLFGQLVSIDHNRSQRYKYLRCTGLSRTYDTSKRIYVIFLSIVTFKFSIELYIRFNYFLGLRV